MKRGLQRGLSKLIADLPARKSKQHSRSQPRVGFVVMASTDQRAFSTRRNLAVMTADSTRWQGLSAALRNVGSDRHNVAHATLVALYAGAVALCNDLGVSPAAIIGHALAGEIAALCAAGVLSCADASSLVQSTEYRCNIQWLPRVSVLSNSSGALLATAPGSDHWIALAAVPH